MGSATSFHRCCSLLLALSHAKVHFLSLSVSRLIYYFFFVLCFRWAEHLKKQLTCRFQCIEHPPLAHISLLDHLAQVL